MEGNENMSKNPSPGGAASVRPVGRVVELFAGVGGFRLALEGVPEEYQSVVHDASGYSPSGGRWRVVWANQYEPATPNSQHAWDCYARNFGVPESERELGNCDIARVQVSDIPEHDLLVGGFPCQDYSVAKPLNQAHGIQGKKGVLWWEIHRIVEHHRPRFLLLENVDRLLKSPASQRGRDFALILATLSDLGYAVEWRVVNAADYGFPQRRRRVFIVGRHRSTLGSGGIDGFEVLTHSGILARALSAAPANGAGPRSADFLLEGEPHEISATFGIGRKVSRFENAGFMYRRGVWTQRLIPATPELRWTLGDVVVPLDRVDPGFHIPEEQLGEVGVKATTWRYLKGPKREDRTHAASSAEYKYSEGGMAFPDSLDEPARTILTGEGGRGPSRFKHVIKQDGVFRRLTPVELERLNGFPDGWTEGMPETKRAFMMGNALVVGVARRIGDVLADDMEESES